jgi:tetratricopeptide (TPR) repeat protein
MISREQRIERSNTIARLFDNNRFYTDSKGKALFMKGMALLANHDYVNSRKTNVFRKAAVFFMKAAKRTPDTLDKAYSLGWAGRCYEDYGELGVAIICYCAAVELAPSDIFALERLGDFNFDSEPNDSEKHYKQVLEYDPTSSRVYYKLGKLYGVLNEHDKAIKQHKMAIEVNNGYIASMAEVAIEYAKKGDKQGSLQYYYLSMANDLYEFEKLGDNIEECLISQG